MLENFSISNERLINCLNSDYGINVVSLTRLSLGADLNASVYKAVDYNQISYFVKLRHTQTPDIGVFIIDLLHNAGIHQVIPTIKSTQGYLAQRLESYNMTVYPFIEGEDGFTRKLTDTQWHTLGKVMQQIHNIQIPSSLQNKIKKETFLFKWGNLARSLITHLNSRPEDNATIIALHTFMIKYQKGILQLIERAERLAAKHQNQLSSLVLCHSDIHAGNVLIDKNNNLFIVDWDEPILAPKERDLMFIGGGVANVWNNSEEEEIFYKGYGRTHIDMETLAYYRHARIVEDIVVLAQELLVVKDKHTQRILYKHFTDQFEPEGVVDIAFRTWETISET